MRRIAAVITALVVVLGMSTPAGAYNHLGATNNTALSIQWSQQLFEGGTAPSAILVRSDSFADSLAAGALAGYTSAPVLMNPPGGGLDDRIATELARLGTDLVRVIGGTAAVSDETVTDLEYAGYEVERYAGANRLATAVEVMKAPADDEGTVIYDGTPAVYLARAFGTGSAAFADSLGAGMLAGTHGFPLLLTATDALSTETRDAIAAVDSIETVFIVGGTAAVSQGVEDALVAMGLDVERIAGNDRFETAARTAELSFNPEGSRLVALVDGLHANSWASGYAASARYAGAVLLSNGADLPAPTASFLSAQDGGDLYCAPEVAHDACLAAEDLLNG